MTTLGIVPYLNAVPLVAEIPPGLLARSGTPSVLSDWLEHGEVDAALLPVAEALRGVGGGFLGRHGIACDGPVDSVLLFLPGAPRGAPWPARIVLDPASRTSVMLLKVLAARRGARGTVFETPSTPDPDPAARSDAATLVIGDRALHLARAWTGAILDLGAAWKEATGLPFVFARWTARRGLPPAEAAGLAAALDDAARRGIARIDDLARAHAEAHGLRAEEARRYLRSSLRFEIDDRAEAGFARFRAEVLSLRGGT